LVGYLLLKEPVAIKAIGLYGIACVIVGKIRLPREADYYGEHVKVVGV
jgi:hypothetical protein